MDNHDHEKEHTERERRNSNTEYIPTKCRITKPPPPKPATNPLQFVKVAPCPLFQKAQEQIKKVEEIKKERKEIREEVEDWQQNLDNWKSSRRKRQEHIIERVVEVKKLTEQEELDKTRRRSKTFSEMMEERSKGRHKFTIPVYDDDSNDLSDYGIGSSSSKTNSIKDVDTDDSSSILDEKDNHSFDSPSNRDNSSTSNQSQSEDETNVTKKEETNTSLINNNNICPKTYSSTYTTSLSTNIKKPNILSKPKSFFETKLNNETNNTKESTEQYTYEGAIQDYRSRIQSKINVDESIFTRNKELSKSKEFSEAQTVLPKGEIFKRKGLFEGDKSVEVNHLESNSSRRLSEDFANTRSIKDRLKSLEKSTDQSSKIVNRGDIQVSVKQRLQNFNKQNDCDKQNNNTRKNSPNKISNYLLDKSNSTPSFQTKKTSSWKINSSDRCSSPETELYMNKLNMFNRDLDNLMNGKSIDDNLQEYCANSNYAPSVSSVELTGISSDREDSGIHTADVSCSVSQADEPIDTDSEMALNTIPSCIEKLNKENELTQFEKDMTQFEKELSQFEADLKHNKESNNNNNSIKEVSKKPIAGTKEQPMLLKFSKQEVVNFTQQLLDSLRIDASENIYASRIAPSKTSLKDPVVIIETAKEILPATKPKPVIYENVELKPYKSAAPVEFITNDFLVDSPFSLSSPMMEPPKVKPPPPPPPEEEDSELSTQALKRLNSTKRIKKEIHIKRSSFLGLDEPTDDQIDPDIPIDKPPELNSFLQKESKLEKSLYKKIQDENRLGVLSKVESQDSGLDIDRGRLSSDTWCSSVGDSSIPSHERQDSEQTNSITSEEDEITKKEREIIEMVEKEEQSRDTIEYANKDMNKSKFLPAKVDNISSYEPSLGSEQFNSPYFPQPSSDFLDDQDSEVLKVEHELRQLEREELERQRESLLFRESRAKARLQNNRHSLDNICDEIYPYYPTDNTVDYRKSMPELQNVPVDYRKSVPDIPPSYVYRQSIPDVDLQYRKSMPNIQHAYQKSSPEQHRTDRSLSLNNDSRIPLDHRKSMPELQHDMHHSAFKSPPPVNRQPIMPGKPLRTIKDLSVFNPIVPHNLQNPNVKGSRQLSKHSLQALSAVPRPRHVPNDNWIQPKANPEVKTYNQHWVFQEAELRRISDQQKNVTSNRNWQQPRHEKHLPDSIIQSLTQRIQNRTNINERNQQNRRSEGSLINKDYLQQHPYLGHPQTVGHALPTMPYSPPIVMEESQDRMLSVSGKKKCSYCGNELGRGAAMIIESLCLFYHMECFKCCVCHVQLGDGLMGTDVRVRNQKLHCHNCYSSDDGVKFSCV